MKDPTVNSKATVPGSTEKHQGPFMLFKTYLSQRFSIVTFGSLALYLVLFTKTNLRFQPSDAVSFIIVLLFLLAMRLYDDLQNARYDQHKPNRIYTDPATSKSLYGFFAATASLALALLTFIDLRSSATLLLFLLVNHVLYLLLVNRSAWRYYLPLLKYPLIAGLVANGWSTATLALFLAFLTFDLIDDKDFPLPRWSKILSSLMAFMLLLPSASQSHYVYIGLLAIIATGSALSRVPYSGYLFLSFLLLARLIDPLYDF